MLLLMVVDSFWQWQRTTEHGIGKGGTTRRSRATCERIGSGFKRSLGGGGQWVARSGEQGVIGARY